MCGRRSRVQITNTRRTRRRDGLIAGETKVRADTFPRVERASVFNAVSTFHDFATRMRNRRIVFV